MRCGTVGSMVILGLAVLMALSVAEAQSRGKMPRIGVLEPGTRQRPPGCIVSFQQGLRSLGYVEGHNLTVDYRYAEEQSDRLPTRAAELVQLAPDVLWTHSTAAAQAAKQVTTTIPIVVGVAVDLVKQGLVEGLARPGGNLTGMELLEVDLLGKRLELLWV